MLILGLLRMAPLNTEVFCTGYDYAVKADLIKGYWNPKRKMWVIMHFSEIINKQPSKKATKYRRMHDFLAKFNLNYL